MCMKTDTIDGKRLTLPRRYTSPLREDFTTRGEAFIEWCENVLGVTLYAWQKWVARHALETREDGSYRFKVIYISMGRQNGKTMLASCLAAWWLFEDCARDETRPTSEQLVLGCAQNLNIAEKPFARVMDWCEPKPKNEGMEKLAIPQLQALTSYVMRGNGTKCVRAKTGARYIARDGANARGESASRVIFDELREQTNFTAWEAVSQTTKTFSKYGQIFCITSGCKADAVVQKLLMSQFEKGLDTVGFFEWSADANAPADSYESISQANPAMCDGALTFKQLLDEAKITPPATFAREVLNISEIDGVSSFASVDNYRKLSTGLSTGGETLSTMLSTCGKRVFAIDISADRKYTSIACTTGGDTINGGDTICALAIPPRQGILWVREWCMNAQATLETRGIPCEFVIQARGCPASELIPELEKAGVNVSGLDAMQVASAGAQYREAIQNSEFVTPFQDPVANALAWAVERPLGEMPILSRKNSKGDIAPLVACALSLYGFRTSDTRDKTAGKREPVVSAYQNRGLMLV